MKYKIIIDGVVLDSTNDEYEANFLKMYFQSMFGEPAYIELLKIA